MAFYDPRKMWFGTLDRMQWITAPQTGADMSSAAESAGGTLLEGGGYELHSWGSHREYVFEWGASSSREDAARMEAYRAGSFGRGLLYFISPLLYDQNILPARWGSPSVVAGNEGRPHIIGGYADPYAVSGWETNNLPATGAHYVLDDIAAGYRSDVETVFIPRPEGMTLYLGAIYTATGSGAVRATVVEDNGTLGASTTLTQVATNATNIVPDSFPSGKGVRLWFGKTASGAATVSVTAMTARAYPSALTPPSSFLQGPWIPGGGHSGCRFIGVPTNVANSGVNGGRITYAASFREVGDSL